MSVYKRKIERQILKKYDGVVTSLRDIVGDHYPSKLFYLLAGKMSYLLDLNADITLSHKSVKYRRILHPIIKILGKHFLDNPQVFENRNFLLGSQTNKSPMNVDIQLPSEPVIYIANHAFKDDTLATILAAKRHAYILFGSLPQFYNTFDGITAWFNGVILVNRKVAASRQSSIEKAIRVINYGSDLMIFPEGVWNKTPNSLMLDLWPGIYRIACKTGAKIVPIVHYLRDINHRHNDNPIHTVIDDPIKIDHLSEQDALNLVRNTLSSWYYLMMNVYGRTTRKEIIGESMSATEAWEKHLQERIQTVARYDTEIEFCADYISKYKVSPMQVWQDLCSFGMENEDTLPLNHPEWYTICVILSHMLLHYNTDIISCIFNMYASEVLLIA